MKTVKTSLFIGLIWLTNCNNQPTQLSDVNEIIEGLNLFSGSWLHEEDNLSTLNIEDKSWVFKHNGEFSSDEDVYSIKLSDNLPEFVKENVKGNFIILTNKTDTLYYEVLGLNDTILSLMNYPTGRLHLYKKKTISEY